MTITRNGRSSRDIIHSSTLFDRSYWERGYREKSHRCLKYAVEALLVDEGLLDASVLVHFSYAMDLREGADYGCIYDAESARTVVESARIVFDQVHR
jgi:uncharacterized protein (UPF0332 family)